MKKILFSMVIITALSMTSCALFFVPALTYKVGLSKVEAPVDAKKQYGETQIIKLNAENNNKYEDSNIEIIWIVSNTQFNFILKNKSNYSIKIPWDDAVYINSIGHSGRVMHNGVKYSECNNSQPASVIPKNATLSDIIMPTENVYFTNGQYGGWDERNLFNYAIGTKDIEEFKQEHIGTTVRLLFPVIIQDVKNEYLFEFKIEDIIGDEESW